MTEFALWTERKRRVLRSVQSWVGIWGLDVVLDILTD